MWKERERERDLLFFFSFFSFCFRAICWCIYCWRSKLCIITLGF
jgi:hypothetical protein